MSSFAKWLTRPVDSFAGLILLFAAIVTVVAAVTQLVLSLILDDKYVYFFYEGAGRDFQDFMALSVLALFALPFAEELVFRAPLAYVYKKWGAGRALGWSTTLLAVTFAMIHGGLMPQVVSGIFFSAVFLRSLKITTFWRSLVFCSLTHLASNLALAAMQYGWNVWLVPHLG